MFEKKVPTHKFKDYVCTGIEEYAAQGVAKADVLIDEQHHGEKQDVQHIETHNEKDVKTEPKPNV